MKTVALFSALLVTGLVLSQWLPQRLGAVAGTWSVAISLLTMTALAFIMIRVGLEFELEKTQLRAYGWDYLVASTAAAFPWLLVAAYVVFAMLPSHQWASGNAWKESLLMARFAAPTSAGVLFAMLAAAGMAHTWLFRKARALAILDDLDTVLLMIPLKMLMVGVAWQLGVVGALFATMLWAGWRWARRLRVPFSWPWMLGYSVVIVAGSEVVHHLSLLIDTNVPIDIEVLLPAFLLGAVIHRPSVANEHHATGGSSQPGEQRVSTFVSAAFMFLVGLNMPSMFLAEPAMTSEHQRVLARVVTSPGMIAAHVLAVTALSNLGKMFPALCYRREAHWRERVALSVGMWPRGEVGAGVLVVSLGYGITGPVVSVGMISLALNLLLTGVFIAIAKRLVAVGTRRAPVG